MHLHCVEQILVKLLQSRRQAGNIHKSLQGIVTLAANAVQY